MGIEDYIKSEYDKVETKNDLMLTFHSLIESVYREREKEHLSQKEFLGLCICVLKYDREVRAKIEREEK